MQKEIETFCPANRQEWRQWLQENHRLQQSVWLVQYKQKSSKPSLSWSDAVDEALCFGWIDSTRRTIDQDSFVQVFTKRKPISNWSKINKAKIMRLTEEGLMTNAGLEIVELAKQNGSWTILDEVEELNIPEDLEKAFLAEPDSRAFFLSLSKSVKKMILQWIVLAKRQETRAKRIAETVSCAARKQRPNNF
ncbi:YdeI/OmpD-associated family protein [Pedobacter frigoris]|uniref:YdeI/OmpD-associated family protein n=1 Tax=Pedobacter frigoris TaxID=2571272 RepID=UPI00292D43F8|nr:YdeI/OmpD-associated family protein [Pedobacter frigoris]